MSHEPLGISIKKELQTTLQRLLDKHQGNPQENSEAEARKPSAGNGSAAQVLGSDCCNKIL